MATGDGDAILDGLDSGVTVQIEAVAIEKDGTTQTKVVDTFTDLGTPDECITPPTAPEQWAHLTGSSGVRRPALEALSLNTVGLGYTLAPRKHAAAEDQEQVQPERMDAARTALEAAAGRDERLDGPSFAELMRAVKYDEEEVGQGFLEVSRNRRDGTIDGLFHLPAKRMRRRQDRKGWVLLPPDGDARNGVFYRTFGTKVLADTDGKSSATLQPGASWADNEVLTFKLYSSDSRDYGTPRDAALVFDYLADKLATEANIAFFQSSGTPPTILFVGGEAKQSGSTVRVSVPQESVQRIVNTMRSGPDNRSRVAVVPMPPNTKAEAVQLGEVSQRDLGYNEFRAEHAKRVLGTFRLQPIFVPIVDTSARYDAEVQRAITLEQVFDPEQDRYETRLTATILAGLGFSDVAITFKRLAVEADAARREAAERMAEVGAITNGEFREAHGYKPLPEGDTIPADWNKTLITPPKPVGTPTPEVNDAQDQRGLRPGIGGRVSRDKTTGQPSRAVDGTVVDLTAAVGGAAAAQRQRAADRARRA